MMSSNYPLEIMENSAPPADDGGDDRLTKAPRQREGPGAKEGSSPERATLQGRRHQCRFSRVAGNRGWTERHSKSPSLRKKSREESQRTSCLQFSYRIVIARSFC